MHRNRTATLTGLAVLAASATSYAATVYSQNFDSLAVGNLVGQGTPAFDAFPATPATINSGKVAAGIGVGGSQAAQLDTSPQVSTSFFFQFPITYDLTGQQASFAFDFDLNPALLPGDPASRSAFSAGLYNAAGSRITGVGFSPTGDITYTNAAGTPSLYTPPVPINSTQGFHNVVLNIDFSLAVPTGTIVLDGVTLPITAGVVLANGKIVTDVDMVSTPTGFDVGVFDNMLLTATPVPEPTTLAAMAGAGLTLVRRRR